MAEVGGSHPCRADDCPKVISYQFLMCPAHWRRVPYGIRSKVLMTWARVCADDGRLSDEYLAAVEEAKASVKK